MPLLHRILQTHEYLLEIKEEQVKRSCEVPILISTEGSKAEAIVSQTFEVYLDAFPKVYSEHSAPSGPLFLILPPTEFPGFAYVSLDFGQWT